MNNHLRIVVFKEEDMFIAQCLEHDIAVQAGDFPTLKRRFEATIALEGNLESLPPAPGEYQAMWDHGLELAARVDNAETRLAA